MKKYDYKTFIKFALKYLLKSFFISTYQLVIFFIIILV